MGSKDHIGGGRHARDSICLLESGRLRLSVEKDGAFQIRETRKEAQGTVHGPGGTGVLKSHSFWEFKSDIYILIGNCCDSGKGCQIPRPPPLGPGTRPVSYTHILLSLDCGCFGAYPGAVTTTVLHVKYRYQGCHASIKLFAALIRRSFAGLGPLIARCCCSLGYKVHYDANTTNQLCALGEAAFSRPPMPYSSCTSDFRHSLLNSHLTGMHHHQTAEAASSLMR